jgi:amino acid adenylation domain-containing protein
MEHGTDRLIHQLFEEQAARTPDRTAVVVGTRRISYRRLDALADGIAHRLVAEGIEPGGLVGVCADRDERLIAALLGVFKAGAAYVPLDPAYPADRLSFIREDARLTHVLVTKDHLELAGSTGAAPLLLDDIAPADSRPAAAAPSDGPAYIVYTSGSTGRPKGVVIQHQAAANFVRWAVSTMDDAEMAGSLAGLSVCFDGSTLEIFPPLASGGAVIMAESLLELPTLPARDEVTMVVAPPSALRVLLHHGLPGGVRLVYPVGEALSSSLVAELFTQPGVLRVRNGYGPTETTTLSHCHDMYKTDFRNTGDAPPIGRLVAGATGLVLDAEGRLLPEGELGELWIGGPGLARGYLRRPELTAERFVADPSVPGGRRYRTGDLVRRAGDVFRYAGRIDDQVKIRGFRVELGEVETALAAHPGVGAAVACAPADELGVRTLLGYVTPVSGTEVTEDELREYLGDRLPAYLVPSRIGVLDQIPLGPTGKADRSSLPALAPAVSRTAPTPPRDEREAAVAEVFADVLGVASVGIHDDFFALGGHSLGAALAVARLTTRFELTVPLAWLLAGPTVAALAARIADGAHDDEPRPQRHAGRTTFPLSMMQSNQWAALQAAPQCNNTIGFELRLFGVPDAAAVQFALDRVVRRHEVLRTVLVREGQQWPTALVRPPAPVPLAEFDLHDTPQAEAESIVEAALSHSFDLYTSVPLLRGTLLWTGPGEARLVVMTEHIAFDGYSIGLFTEELADGLALAVTGDPDEAPEPALQFGDVAVLQAELYRRPCMEQMRDFWRGELAGANSPNLPAELRESLPLRGKRMARLLDQDAVARLRSLETACATTRFTVFAAAVGILMRAYTGYADNLLGTVAALRDRPGTGEVIGPVFDVVAVRIRVGDGVTFRELAASAADARSRALAHQELGFGGIMQVGFPGQELNVRTQLTPVVLSMQPDTVQVDVARGPVRVELAGELDTGGTSLCDLAVLVNAVADGLQVQLMYDTNRFTDAEMDTFLRRLFHVLDAAAADPDRAVDAYAAKYPALGG